MGRSDKIIFHHIPSPHHFFFFTTAQNIWILDKSGEEILSAMLLTQRWSLDALMWPPSWTPHYSASSYQPTLHSNNYHTYSKHSNKKHQIPLVWNRSEWWINTSKNKVYIEGGMADISRGVDDSRRDKHAKSKSQWQRLLDIPLNA